MRTLTKTIFGIAMLAGMHNRASASISGILSPSVSMWIETIIAAASGAGIRTCIVKSGFPRGTPIADAGGIVTTGTLTATTTAAGIADIAAAEPFHTDMAPGSPGPLSCAKDQAVWAALQTSWRAHLAAAGSSSSFPRSGSRIPH